MATTTAPAPLAPPIPYCPPAQPVSVPASIWRTILELGFMVATPANPGYVWMQVPTAPQSGPCPAWRCPNE